MNRKKVAKWLAAAGSLAVLTSCRGELVPYAAERTSEFLTAEPVILRDREAGRRFLMETVSAAEREGRQEIVVTGKDSSFDTLVIAQMFPGVVNISKLDLGTRNVNGETVTDCRIGFEWRGRVPDSGENTVPGTGDKFGEEEDRAAWRTGDVVSREIAGKAITVSMYHDDDYQDGRGSYGKRALFLAENVIRSDVDSTYEERILLPFGENNNYKKSRVREWLGEQAETAVPDASFVYTGALTAFTGKTGDGDFADSRLDGLEPFAAIPGLPGQILSAVFGGSIRYRDEIWNPEGKGSSYSRGFWLRTPAYEVDERGSFVYGNREYVVDLENGCFRQADVSDVGIGICPAFCLPQA
ncbi:MAG: hypothetical protein ACLTFJ_10850 [Clostridium sp.]